MVSNEVLSQLSVKDSLLGTVSYLHNSIDKQNDQAYETRFIRTLNQPQYLAPLKLEYKINSNDEASLEWADIELLNIGESLRVAPEALEDWYTDDWTIKFRNELLAVLKPYQYRCCLNGLARIVTGELRPEQIPKAAQRIDHNESTPKTTRARIIDKRDPRNTRSVPTIGNH